MKSFSFLSQAEACTQTQEQMNTPHSGCLRMSGSRLHDSGGQDASD